jgi:methionyl-tRNA formyltransferase
MNKPFTIIFFGTGPLAESVVSALVRGGYTPSLIITKVDKKVGRHQELTSPMIKKWAEQKGIPVLQPSTFDATFLQTIQSYQPDLAIVASYGKILPDTLLALPKHGFLNVHPSLLPLYRGPSPIESALLDGNNTIGLSIMKLDKEMDHGPLLVQSYFPINQRDTSATLEVKAGIEGGTLLTQILPHYVDGTLIPKEQDHSKATYCHKITKEQGEISLTDSAQNVLTRWRALTPWPGIFFTIPHHEQHIRVKITELATETVSETLLASDIITKVIPEGKREVDWKSFKQGYL